MIEIIPNWHPLLVHFTLGLLSTSVLFYLAAALLSSKNSWKQQWLNMANWSLWSGCLFAIATAVAGWFAYNSVAHDSASHAAMTLHRNWALPTASTFLLLGLWAILMARKDRRPGFLFLTFSMIAAGLLMVTGWLGAEAVYRYGLGVQSLPVVIEGADGHNHSHGAGPGESAMEEGMHQHGMAKSEQPLTEEGHQHSHKNKKILPETEQSLKQDGHQHEHESQAILPEQSLNEAPHQHSHETNEKPVEIEQPLKQDGHQHEHESQTILPEQPLNEPPHQHSHENEETHHHSQINKEMIFNTELRNERRVSLATGVGLLLVLKAWLQMDKTQTYSRLSNS